MATALSRTTLRWGGTTLAAVFALLLLAFIVLASLDWNRFKGPVERYASKRAARDIAIGGDLDVRLWTLHPRVSVEKLRVSGVEPYRSSRLLELERGTIELELLALLKGDVILSRVELVEPQLVLRRDRNGRTNWSTASGRAGRDAPARRPPDLPVVRNFVVRDGRLDVRDAKMKLQLAGSLDAFEQADASGRPASAPEGAGRAGERRDPAAALRIAARGSLNDRPFDLRIGGGPLINLTPDRPYPFQLAVAAGDIRIAAAGRVLKPFDFGRVALDVEATGQDLADLYFLTRLAWPNTPSYRLAARVDRDGSMFRVTKFDGRVGSSDVRGTFSIDVAGERPRLAGDLFSQRLVLSDLLASFGRRGSSQSEADSGERGAGDDADGRRRNRGAGKATRLFPDARLQVERLRAMDAAVQFRADEVVARSWPLERVAMTLKLDGGVLSLNPFEFVMPQGQITGVARIDANAERPHTRLDLRVRGIQLDQFKGRAPGAKPPLGGIVQARAKFAGHGASVHELAANADGSATFVLPQGEIRAALAELTGINVARGIGLLLTKDQDRAEIRCGIAQFDVRDGVMHAHNIVVDTEDVRIEGRGEIRLGSEQFDLSIEGEPKKPRLARLRTPVEIGGTLLDPDIGIDKSETIKQGGIAAAIGAALAPLAAVLAFVDPGLAKDENCAQLLTASRGPAAR